MQATTLLTAPQSTVAPSRSLWTLLKTAMQSLIGGLVITSDPQVNQIDSNGETFWYAFDPKTGRELYAVTETEVRLWVEENC